VCWNHLCMCMAATLQRSASVHSTQQVDEQLACWRATRVCLCNLQEHVVACQPDVKFSACLMPLAYLVLFTASRPSSFFRNLLCGLQGCSSPQVRPAIPVRVLAPKQTSTFQYVETLIRCIQAPLHT
jgi:hypothetical protein